MHKRRPVIGSDAARARRRILAACLACVSGAACSEHSDEVTELESFPLDVSRTFIPDGDVSMDPYVSWDGKGSLRIHADSAVVVPVVDLREVEIDDALLVYEAKVRTRDLTGLAYLEMSCLFPDRGEFYSRGLRTPLTGSNGWSSQHVRFRLRPGEKPESIRLSLVLTGSGTAWVDAVTLFRFDAG